MPRPSIETVSGWRKKALVDREGAPLGHIVHIYLDQVTGEPEWALVASGQGGRQVFVPLVDAAEHQDQIHVPVERTLVSDAPAIRPGRQLSKEDTARLHGHYGGAPELRWASARRAPGGGPTARLRRRLGRARERAASPPAVSGPCRPWVHARVAGSTLLLWTRQRPSPFRCTSPERSSTGRRRT